jgi:hypothetical protein
MKLSDFTNIASYYEPEGVIELANAGFHLGAPEVYTVGRSVGQSDSRSDEDHTPIPPDAHTPSYTIHKGKIHFVSCDDQESASEASVALALQLQENVSLTYLSFAGNSDIIPKRILEADLNSELSLMTIYRFEKFSFYENGRDELFKKYLGNQSPSVLVINMIDWAVQTDRHRLRLAAELGRFADKYGCAIVCFTLESVPRIRRARETGRGWLGLLSRLARKELAYVDSRSVGQSDGRSAEDHTPTQYCIKPLQNTELPPACKFSDKPVDTRPARERFRSPYQYLEPRTPLEKMPFEQLTLIPIEQKFHENDWYRPWAIESKWISKIVRELEFKKKHGLLRMDPDKNKEYHKEYPEFYKKFKEMYCEATGETEIISM